MDETTTVANWHADTLDKAEQWEAEGKDPVLFWSGQMAHLLGALLRMSVADLDSRVLQRLDFCLKGYDAAIIRKLE